MSKGSKEAQNTSMSCLNEICERTERIAPNQLKLDKSGIQGIVGKDQRATCWSTIWYMIENIKEIFPPNTGMREKQLLQDPGYVKGVKSTCCMVHGTLQGCMKYPMSKESKEIKITIIQ